MILLQKYGFVRDLIQNLPLGIVIADNKGKIVFFNAYMQKHFNVFADEFLNESLQTFMKSGVFHVRGRSFPVTVRTHSKGKYKIYYITRMVAID